MYVMNITIGGDNMAYRVYKFEVGKEINGAELEKFLNLLDGEVISIVPNIVPTFHLMGATANYDYLLIVVKSDQQA